MDSPSWWTGKLDIGFQKGVWCDPSVLHHLISRLHWKVFHSLLSKWSQHLQGMLFVLCVLSSWFEGLRRTICTPATPCRLRSERSPSSPAPPCYHYYLPCGIIPKLHWSTNFKALLHLWKERMPLLFRSGNCTDFQIHKNIIDPGASAFDSCFNRKRGQGKMNQSSLRVQPFSQASSFYFLIYSPKICDLHQRNALFLPKGIHQSPGVRNMITAIRYDEKVMMVKSFGFMLHLQRTAFSAQLSNSGFANCDRNRFLSLNVKTSRSASCLADALLCSWMRKS